MIWHYQDLPETWDTIFWKKWEKTYTNTCLCIDFESIRILLTLTDTQNNPERVYSIWLFVALIGTKTKSFWDFYTCLISSQRQFLVLSIGKLFNSHGQRNSYTISNAFINFCISIEYCHFAIHCKSIKCYEYRSVRL